MPGPRRSGGGAGSNSSGSRRHQQVRAQAAHNDLLALSFGGDGDDDSGAANAFSNPSLTGTSAAAAAAQDHHPFGLPSSRRTGGEAQTRRPPPSSAAQSQQPARTAVAPPNECTERGEHDIFFDAGDAMGDADDPLRANATQAQRAQPAAAAAGSSSSSSTNAASGADALPSYDFERQSYFSGGGGAGPSSGGGASRPGSPTTPRSHPPSRRTSRGPYDHGGGAGSSANLLGGDGHGSGSGPAHLDAGAGAHRTRSASGSGPSGDNSVARLRVLLGRFGRLVGMRVPGAVYTTLAQHDGEDSMHGGAGAAPQRRRVVGSGLGSDGVFANLNAKPDSRRRRRRDGAGESADRGEDDDLAEDAQPPAYETAAADQAPPYWETTIIGPGGLHPLAPGGLGWTPGSPVVGAIEDMMLDGLAIGNFFGLAWNLLVSTSFQFVGFLLTYLLHTTHAARCGSRAGLGITLVQYGYYLRTAAERAGAQGGADSGGDEGGGGAPQNHADDLADDPPSGAGAGAGAGAQQGVVSNGMLAYILIGLGTFIVVTSLLSFWRVYCWAYQLVAAARREQAAVEEGEAGGSASAASAAAAASAGTAAAPDASASAPSSPVTFSTRVRGFFTGGIPGTGAARSHSAEDWVIFPGAGRRLTDLEEGRISHEDDEDDEDDDDATPDTRQQRQARAESARLVSNLRGAGFLA